MTDANLLDTPLRDRHEALGAKFAPFGGWSMPLEYVGTGAEHDAVRTGTGIFDVSHLGTVLVTGPAAGAVVAGAFSNDAASLADGGSQYTLCLTPDGGILDDLIVYRLTAERWLVVPNASNTAAVVAVLQDVAATTGVAEVVDVSRDVAIIAIQGPTSDDVVAAAVGTAADDIERLAVATVDIDGEVAWVARTGYTGERGVEVMCPASVAPGVWDRAVEAGAVPCGLGARDTLRLEMGYPLHGNDLGPDTSPVEARLRWAVSLDHDFPGRDAVAAAAEAGPSRRLLGVRGDGRRPLRAGMDVLVGDTVVGRLTSGSVSPTLGVGIGMGYLDAAVAPGDVVAVDVRGRPVPATVVRPPFVATTTV